MIKKLIILSAFLIGVNFQSQNSTYTVRKGDTPFGISKKHNLTLDELVKLNPALKNKNINVGDVLVVSKTGSVISKSTAVANGYVIIKPKQTIYGLTKQYNISESELRKLNPDLDSNMKVGSKVVIPANLIEKYGNSTEKTRLNTHEKKVEEAPLQSTPQISGNTYTATGTSDDDFVTYTVQSGDTTFGIVNKFGITLDELMSLNSNLSNGLKSSMVLKIKRVDPIYVKKSGDELNIAIMLPFGYDTGDAKYRAMSLDFLLGAKLAIERNAKRGLKLNVNIIDAGNEKTFKNSLTQINKDNTDLIIGPFFKSNVLEVLDYVKTNKIPVVAPLANSEDLYGFSNLVIVETNDKVYADRIVSEVKATYQNQKIYIFQDSSKGFAEYIKVSLQKELKNPDIKIVSTANEIELDTNIMTGQRAPIIAILASNSETSGESFANRLIVLSKESQGNKAFSMYYTPAFEKNEEVLMQSSLVYIMDRKINKDGIFEKEILSQFNDRYCKTPSKYSVIGFDIVNDMLLRENNKGDIFNQMGKSQTQLATKFEFVRAQKNGAYINTGYRLVRLNP